MQVWGFFPFSDLLSGSLQWASSVLLGPELSFCCSEPQGSHLRQGSPWDGSLLGAHMFHMETQRSWCPWSRPVGVRATPRCPPFPSWRSSLRPFHEAPQKVLAGAIQMGDWVRAWSWMGLPSLPAHFPQPLSPASGDGVTWSPPLPSRDLRLWQNTLGCLLLNAVHVPNTQ